MSSKAEFGNLGLDPSHLSFVLSSDGTGKKVNVDITTLPLVEFVICGWRGEWIVSDGNEFASESFLTTIRLLHDDVVKVS